MILPNGDWMPDDAYTPMTREQFNSTYGNRLNYDRYMAAQQALTANAQPAVRQQRAAQAQVPVQQVQAPPQSMGEALDRAFAEANAAYAADLAASQQPQPQPQQVPIPQAQLPQIQASPMYGSEAFERALANAKAAQAQAQQAPAEEPGFFQSFYNNHMKPFLNGSAPGGLTSEQDLRQYYPELAEEQERGLSAMDWGTQLGTLALGGLGTVRQGVNAHRGLEAMRAMEARNAAGAVSPRVIPRATPPATPPITPPVANYTRPPVPSSGRLVRHMFTPGERLLRGYPLRRGYSWTVR